MLPKSIRSKKFMSLAKSAVCGLTTAVDVVSDIAWDLLQQFDSKPSTSNDEESQPKAFNYHYGSADNHTSTGWTLTHVDDDGNYL
jgi:hypothetical protein